MLTTKQLRLPIAAPTWKAPKAKTLFQLLAITALTTVLFPRVSAGVMHQLRVQAADGRSCFRVAPDRKSQVRKYGADCNL